MGFRNRRLQCVGIMYRVLLVHMVGRWMYLANRPLIQDLPSRPTSRRGVAVRPPGALDLLNSPAKKIVQAPEAYNPVAVTPRTNVTAGNCAYKFVTFVARCTELSSTMMNPSGRLGLQAFGLACIIFLMLFRIWIHHRSNRVKGTCFYVYEACMWASFFLNVFMHSFDIWSSHLEIRLGPHASEAQFNKLLDEKYLKVSTHSYDVIAGKRKSFMGVCVSERALSFTSLQG